MAASSDLVSREDPLGDGPRLVLVYSAAESEVPRGTSDERELFLRWLRFLRGAVTRSLEGLSDEQARWRPDEALICLLGIVNHLTHGGVGAGLTAACSAKRSAGAMWSSRPGRTAVLDHPPATASIKQLESAPVGDRQRVHLLELGSWRNVQLLAPPVDLRLRDVLVRLVRADGRSSGCQHSV